MDLADLATRFEEVSELFGRTQGFRPDDVWFPLKLQGEVGELTQAFLLVRAKRVRRAGRR
jgi:hypothetical protein